MPTNTLPEPPAITEAAGGAIFLDDFYVDPNEAVREYGRLLRNEIERLEAALRRIACYDEGPEAAHCLLMRDMARDAIAGRSRRGRMKYALDTEFIDTATCSALISLAIVAEDGRKLYLEFEYPDRELTPWLRQHVVPHLTGERCAAAHAAEKITSFMDVPVHGLPEFWCYYGGYDWYWFCRLYGGFMQLPAGWPHRFREFSDIQRGIPNVSGPEHNALNDARSLMAALRKRT